MTLGWFFLSNSRQEERFGTTGIDISYWLGSWGATASQEHDCFDDFFNGFRMCLFVFFRMGRGEKGLKWSNTYFCQENRWTNPFQQETAAGTVSITNKYRFMKILDTWIGWWDVLGQEIAREKKEGQVVIGPVWLSFRVFSGSKLCTKGYDTWTMMGFK